MLHTLCRDLPSFSDIHKGGLNIYTGVEKESGSQELFSCLSNIKIHIGCWEVKFKSTGGFVAI